MPHDIRSSQKSKIADKGNNTYMYCSVVKNVIDVPVEEGEGAVKVEAYHWDRKPYGSSYSRH